MSIFVALFGLALAIGSGIGAMLNMASHVTTTLDNPSRAPNSFGLMFRRHLLFGVGVLVGVGLMAAGLLMMVVEYGS